MVRTTTGEGEASPFCGGALSAAGRAPKPPGDAGAAAGLGASRDGSRLAGGGVVGAPLRAAAACDEAA
jgi:hypothetical protein